MSELHRPSTDLLQTWPQKSNGNPLLCPPIIGASRNASLVAQLACEREENTAVCTLNLNSHSGHWSKILVLFSITDLRGTQWST